MYTKTEEKAIQCAKECDAWLYFKQAVEVCMRLHFSERQLLAHIQLKYCVVKGVVEGEGIHE